jgi:hypothetical protein
MLALRRLGQKDSRFQTNLGNTVKLLKKKVAKRLEQVLTKRSPNASEHMKQNGIHHHYSLGNAYENHKAYLTLSKEGYDSSGRAPAREESKPQY